MWCFAVISRGIYRTATKMPTFWLAFFKFNCA
jgi:hypothetical protein